MQILPIPEGFTAKDMILELADSLRIERFEFAVYSPLADGYGTPPRAVKGYLAADVANLSIEDIRRELAAAAGPEAGIVEAAVREEIGEHDDTYALGLSSRVIAGGCEFHLPQMDFGLNLSQQNLERVYDYLERIGQRDGYVIESGRSYHFQGVDIMPKDLWFKWIDGLDDNIVDGAWINESGFTRGFSLLRLTAAYKKPQAPRIISRVREYRDQITQAVLPFKE